MANKISIIIPCYNIQNYLPYTIDSVIAQTYTDFEVLLIDDGSTDKTLDICRQYALKDSRIKYIHKENGGVSSARNAGLDAAIGEWIFFLDGDDILLSNALSILLNTAIEHNCEIVEANYERIKNGKRIYSPLVCPNDYLEKSEVTIKNTLLYNRVLIYPRLFKKTFIGDKRFDTSIRVGEDILFVIDLLLNNEIYIAHNKEVVYQYIQREGSAMHHKTTHEEYIILSDAMSNRLSNYEHYKNYLQLFCCINIYFKAVKERLVISNSIYKQYMKGLYSIVNSTPILAKKFKVLFYGYGINRHLGNLMMRLRIYLLPAN